MPSQRSWCRPKEVVALAGINCAIISEGIYFIWRRWSDKGTAYWSELRLIFYYAHCCAVRYIIYVIVAGLTYLVALWGLACNHGCKVNAQGLSGCAFRKLYNVTTVRIKSVVTKSFQNGVNGKVRRTIHQHRNLSRKNHDGSALYLRCCSDIVLFMWEYNYIIKLVTS